MAPSKVKQRFRELPQSGIAMESADTEMDTDAKENK